MNEQRHWKDATISSSATIKEVIQCLDKSALQIVLVINSKGSLEGTITDGDIRRGLLKGMDLNSTIENIIHRDSLVVPPQMDREMVLQIMQANKIHQLPVVDEERHVVDMHTWDEVNSKSIKDNVMVIMAGGLGTRLRPHTEKCPKPMLPVAGKPMMEHIIEQAKAEGFQRFIVSTHYLSHLIKKHFCNGDKWGISIEYITEDQPLGTAGGLDNLNDKVDAPFVVTNGDVLTDIRYSELLDFHIRQNAEATMAVRMYEWQHPYGVVEIDGVDITGFEEKPITRTHVNAGVYALNPSVLELLNKDERCDMPTLFNRLKSQKRRTIAYPMHEPWLDVGRPDDLEKARTERNNK